MTDELRPVRPRKGGRTHATLDYRVTVCGKPSDGWLVAETVPDCKQCLAKLARK